MNRRRVQITGRRDGSVSGVGPHLARRWRTVLVPIVAAAAASSYLPGVLGNLIGLTALPAAADTSSTYQQQVLTDGASVYYSLDGAGSNPTGVFNGVPGTINTLTESPGWTAGPELLASSAASGASSIVAGSTGGTSTCCSYTNALSWTGWVEVPAGQSWQSFAPFVDTGNYQNAGFTFEYNAGQLEFVTIQAPGNAYTAMYVTTSLPVGVPIMIGATFDGTKGTVYLNGRSIGSQAMSAAANSSGPHLVGAYRSGLGNYYKLTTAEDSVAFFPSALTATQIQTEYNIGSQLACGPVSKDDVRDDTKEARRKTHGRDPADRRREAAKAVGRHSDAQAGGVEGLGELRTKQVGYAKPADRSGQPGQQPPVGHRVVPGVPRPCVRRPDR